MSSYRKSLLVFIIFILLFEIIIAYAFDIKTRPGWNDEAKLHKTFVQFAENLNWETLKHYEQMSPPLPFLIFGFWGKIFGTELFNLRMLNIFISILTYLIFHRILYLLFENKKTVLFSAVYLVIHPYMAGLSLFVYTDMMSIMFLLLAFLMLIQKRLILLPLFLACAILTRQYLLFFTIGTAFFYMLRWTADKDKTALKYFISLLISCLPYLILIFYWGGLSPDNQWRQYFLDTGISFKPEFLIHYICLLFLYPIPFYIFRLRSFYSDKKILISSIIISPIYFLFPVTYEYSHIVGVDTVGLFDRALQYMIGNGFIIQTIYFCLFLLALPVVLIFIIDSYNKISNNKFDYTLLINLIIFSFLIIMPFSYIGWEKYFIPLLPFLIIRILLENKKRSGASGSRPSI